MCKKYFAIALLLFRRAAALGYVCSNRAKPQIVLPRALQQRITRGPGSRFTLTTCVLRRRTSVADQAREELRKWLDVSAYTRGLESRHVVVAARRRRK